MRRGTVQARRAISPVSTDPTIARQLVPIVKRLPAYLRLGWALGRDPAIPQRHKTLLYSAALYSVSPANLVIGAVPVVGQVDTIVLFLLGVRQALRHCPPGAAARHLARVRLGGGQLDQDLATLGKVAKRAASEVGRALKDRLRFASRVAAGFARRTARRLVGT